MSLRDVFSRSDAGFVFEHAGEMMRIIETEHVRRLADASTAHEDVLRQTNDVRLNIILGRRARCLFHNGCNLSAKVQFFCDICKNGSQKMMFFFVFCKNGRYSANICYSISAKSSNFAVEMRKCKIKKKGTLHMVKSLQLVATEPLAPEAMPLWRFTPKSNRTPQTNGSNRLMTHNIILYNNEKVLSQS